MTTISTRFSRFSRSRPPAARLLLAAAVALSALLSAAPAFAGGGLRLTDAWVRTIVPSRPAAAYFTLHNDGDSQRVLVGATSPACRKTMLHQSKTVNGVDHMMPVKQVTVPAKGTFKFAPRGYHVMCMMPAKTVTPGNTIEITLEFRDGGTLAGHFKVYGARGKD